MSAWRMDYESIREQAGLEGRRVNELLAMAPGSDPFYAETTGRMRAGAWFADIWRMLGRPNGAHLRRLHYQLASQDEPPPLPDGQPYRNTLKDWQFLNSASRNARYLRLVDPTALEDHRSAPPVLFASSRPTPTPDWTVDGLEPWAEPPALPNIETDITWSSNLSAPRPTVSGYDYLAADQPYHLEIWIEKSTMTDVLEPICRQHGIDLVVGVGYLSITRVVEMLRRVADHGKPARIFYISDFDPSGENMPLQVARQSEFWLPDLAPDADLKLDPLALTPEQVRAYGLPKMPIKDTHTAKDEFEARHGEGATELDALEALRPGELARLVEEAIEPYIDRDLNTQLGLAWVEARNTVTAAWEAATEVEREELADIDAEAEQIADGYRDELEQIAARLDAELAPLKERLDLVWQAIRDKRMDLKVQLPDRPESDLDPPDSEEDWLFSSDRDYEDQLDYYKERRPGVAAVKPSRRVVCVICGTPRLARRKDTTTCSTACQIKLSNSRQNLNLPRQPCEICGTEFMPKRRNNRFCSMACNGIAQNRKKAERKAAAVAETAS